MAYAVTRRRHEFGVRLALGAVPGRLVADAIREGLVLAAGGTAIGIAAAAAAGQLLRQQLYGIAPNDPSSFAATIAILAATCVLACWIPARRALLSSPMEALRAE